MYSATRQPPQGGGATAADAGMDAARPLPAGVPPIDFAACLLRMVSNALWSIESIARSTARMLASRGEHRLAARFAARLRRLADEFESVAGGGADTHPPVVLGRLGDPSAAVWPPYDPDLALAGAAMADLIGSELEDKGVCAEAP